jgi:WD40 repeat protein
MSSDGKTLLLGNEERTAVLLDAATGRRVGETLKHPDKVGTVAFSPDGRTVLTGTFEGKGRRVTTSFFGEKIARLWDASTGRPLGEPLQHRDGVTTAAFSPNSRVVVTGGRDGIVRGWDTATGKPIGIELDVDRAVTLLRFSPDSHTLLVGTEQGATLWDATPGQPIGPRMEHQGGVSAAAFSLDGQMILTGSFDKTARLWRSATCRPVGPPLKHKWGVSEVEFSPDGRTAITTARARTFAPSRGSGWWEPPRTAPAGLITDETVLGEDAELFGKEVRIWNTATGQAVELGLKIARPRGAGSDRDQGESPEPERGGDPRVLRLKVDFEASLRSDGLTVLIGSADGTRLWDAITGRPLAPPINPKGRSRVMFMPGGQFLLALAEDGSTQLWDATNAKPMDSPLRFPATDPAGEAGNEDVQRQSVERRPKEPTQGVKELTFSRDGRVVLTFGFDGKVRLWDVATGRPLGPFFKHNLDVEKARVLAFAAAGRIVLLGEGYRSQDGRAQLWNTATGLPFGLPLRHSRPIVSADFSPDGERVVTGSEDGTVRLWNTASGQALGPWFRHQGLVHSVAFSPDGRSVLTASDDHTARLWDAATWPDEWATELKQRVEAITGLTLDDQDEIRGLEAHEWSERFTRLISKGSAVYQQPRWSLDPIVYGPEPTARARGWAERGRWAEAEAAFNEAVQAWPENWRIRWERGRFFAARSRLDEAAVEFVHAMHLNMLFQHTMDVLASTPFAEPMRQAAVIRANAELSKEVLSNKEIGDRVHARTPKELFALLDPLARAKYWAASKRWTEADAAFDEAQAPYFSEGAFWFERGRYCDERGQEEAADRYFVSALNTWAMNHVSPRDYGVPTPELVKHLLDRSVIRNPSAYHEHRRLIEEIRDAVRSGSPVPR